MPRALVRSVVLAFLFLPRSGAAAPEAISPPPGAHPEPWTVEDVLRQEEVGTVDISPDGARAVWERIRPSKEKDARVTSLWLTSLGEESEIALTRGDEDDTSPRFSPDGRHVAFLSRRKSPDGGEEPKGNKPGGRQIWLIDSRGGEPWTVTRLPHGVEGFRWLDAAHLLYTARESDSLRESRAEEAKDDSVVVEDEEHFTPIRLFVADLDGKKVRRLTRNDDQIEEFAPSPDGRWVVTRHITTPHWEAEANPKPKFYLWDLRAEPEGAAIPSEIFPDPLFFPYGFLWAPDGSGFYALRDRSSDPELNGAGVPFLYWFDLAKRDHVEVPLGWPRGLPGGGIPYDVTKDGFVALLADGAVNRLARFTRAGGGWTRAWVSGDASDHVQRFKVGPDGETIITLRSTASTPPLWTAGALRGADLAAGRPILRLNEFIVGKANARAEVITWKGSLGDGIEGILYWPLHFEQGRRYPLVLMIHGGPEGVDLDAFDESWAYYPNLMAARGSFVLLPNYHGSSNYGQEFLESIKKGKYYDLEVPDILAGVDALVEKGLVDPDRLGSIGWSNGAILTIALITRTSRFRAASPGAGDVNWTSDFGNCAFGAQFDLSYLGDAPWRNPALYVEKSPLFKIDKVVTPTLIFFGTEDRNVPTEQGWEMFRAMNMIRKAPVKFILFPGEPHGPRKISHRRRKMEEEIAWFDRYLFSTYALPNEALKEGSPIDLALKGRKTARDGGFLGVRRGGALAPETVPWEGIEVGRFEVTRAQFAAFDRSVAFDASTGDKPMAAVTYERARAYARWLSDRTGQRYRLPTSEEMGRLLAKAEGNSQGEITLDYWAGYALGPDDARKLAPLLAEMGGPQALLRPAGSGRPVDLAAGLPAAPGAKAEAVLVFDLGGNAAEWTDDGSAGRAMGGCAALPSDPAARGGTPPLEVTGLRVVREER